MSKTTYFTMLFLVTLMIWGCKKDKDNTPTTKSITLSITGLEDVGSNYAYEGWIIVDGSPVSTGLFSVDASGSLSQTSFEANEDDVDAATAYVLTIEPSPDSDPSPSAVHILAGDFSANRATLTPEHEAALGTDFTAATAIYVLRAPTEDGDGATNFEAGVWWFRNQDGATLDCCTNLPELPEGWNYEGWAVFDGTPLSTGVWADGEVDGVSRRDSYSNRDINNNADPALAGGFNGNVAGGPNYPGEDFIQNLPSGITSPVDLRGRTVVITVEPVPDTDPDRPFTFKPLVGNVPTNAGLEDLSMSNNAAATNPSGTVTRE